MYRDSDGKACIASGTIQTRANEGKEGKTWVCQCHRPIDGAAPNFGSYEEQHNVDYLVKEMITSRTPSPSKNTNI